MELSQAHGTQAGTLSLAWLELGYVLGGQSRLGKYQMPLNPNRPDTHVSAYMCPEARQVTQGPSCSRF